MTTSTPAMTRQKKTSQMVTEKIPVFLKDLGLLGFCIYVLWIDNDKNKKDIEALQEKNYQYELQMNTMAVNLQHIQDQNDQQNEILDKIIDRLEKFN